jgi:hypothetical protein
MMPSINFQLLLDQKLLAFKVSHFSKIQK